MYKKTTQRKREQKNININIIIKKNEKQSKEKEINTYLHLLRNNLAFRLYLVDATPRFKQR